MAAGSSATEVEDRSARLARLRELAGDLRPVTLARDRCLPVLPALASLLPDGGLQRGSTVAVSGPGATALTHAVLAGPTQAGSWAAWVGARDLGWAAAAELGLALDRVAVVDVDERRRPAVLAALVDAFDLVVVGHDHRPDRAEVRRLEARARERGAVLIAQQSGAQQQTALGDGADVHLECGHGTWTGAGAGWGHLVARRVTVSVRGRRAFDRPRRVDLWLPGPEGVLVDTGDAEGTGQEGARVVALDARRRAG